MSKKIAKELESDLRGYLQQAMDRLDVATKPNGPDRFSYHEVVDRAHIILEMIDTHLAAHPVVQADWDLELKVKAASEAIAAVYQKVGAMDY
jgi:hypothetical protein